MGVVTKPGRSYADIILSASACKWCGVEIVLRSVTDEKATWSWWVHAPESGLGIKCYEYFGNSYAEPEDADL
jgi:hypothetical protein